MGKEIKPTGWHLLLIAGTGMSIYMTLYLHGGKGINVFISVMPILFWIGGYELCKKISQMNRNRKNGR